MSQGFVFLIVNADHVSEHFHAVLLHRILAAAHSGEKAVHEIFAVAFGVDAVDFHPGTSRRILVRATRLPGAVIGVGYFHGNDATDACVLDVDKYRVDRRIQIGVQRQVFVDRDRKRIIGQEWVVVARRIFVARNQQGEKQQSEAGFFHL